MRSSPTDIADELEMLFHDTYGALLFPSGDGIDEPAVHTVQMAPEAFNGT